MWRSSSSPQIHQTTSTRGTTPIEHLLNAGRRPQIPKSLRSRGLNLHNQLDTPCICRIPKQTMNHPKIEAVDFGSNCRLGVCFLHLICFWFYVYLSLVFRAYYHWQICLLIWLLTSFLKFLYIYFFHFPLFLSVYVQASLCDFVCIVCFSHLSQGSDCPFCFFLCSLFVDFLMMPILTRVR